MVLCLQHEQTVRLQLQNLGRSCSAEVEAPVASMVCSCCICLAALMVGAAAPGGGIAAAARLASTGLPIWPGSPCGAIKLLQLANLHHSYKNMARFVIVHTWDRTLFCREGGLKEPSPGNGAEPGGPENWPGGP